MDEMVYCDYRKDTIFCNGVCSECACFGCTEKDCSKCFDDDD